MGGGKSKFVGYGGKIRDYYRTLPLEMLEHATARDLPIADFSDFAGRETPPEYPGHYFIVMYLHSVRINRL